MNRRGVNLLTLWRWWRQPGVSLVLAWRLTRLDVRPIAGGVGNTAAIFSRVGDIQFAPTVLTANSTVDLTAGTIYLVFTADATNGGRVEKLVIMPLGTNVATVLRIWVNNGGVTTARSNNNQIRDVTMPATTVSQVAALVPTEVALNLALPPGYTLYVTIGTTVAAGFDVTAIGGKY